MKRVLSWVLDNLDFLTTVLIAGAVLLLASAGQLTQDQLPTTTLGLLITLTLFLAIKNYRLGLKLHGLESTLSDVQEKLSGSSTRLLFGSEKLFGKLNSVITNTSKLEVTYFSSALPGELLGAEVAKYWTTLAEYLRRFDDFRVRRLVTIESEAKLKWVRQTLADCNMSPNYHLAAIANQETFPLLNVVIVDAHYAAIFKPHSQTSDSPYIFIEDAKTAEALRKYFESLWNVATKVKIAKHLYEDNLLAIGKQLTIGSSGRRSAAAEP